MNLEIYMRVERAYIGLKGESYPTPGAFVVVSYTLIIFIGTLSNSRWMSRKFVDPALAIALDQNYWYLVSTGEVWRGGVALTYISGS